MLRGERGTLTPSFSVAMSLALFDVPRLYLARRSCSQGKITAVFLAFHSAMLWVNADGEIHGFSLASFADGASLGEMQD